MNRPIEEVGDLLACVKEIENLGHEVTIYPDAEEYISRRLYLERIEKEDRGDPQRPKESSPPKDASQDRASSLSARWNCLCGRGRKGGSR